MSVLFNRMRLSLGCCGVWLLLSLSGVVHGSVFDQLIASSDGPLPVDQAYQLSTSPLGQGVYRLHWVIEPGYYLYRDKIKFKPGEGLEVVEVRYPESKLKADPLFGDVAVYYHEAELLLRVQSTQGTRLDGSLGVEYQGCWDGGICYPPVEKIQPLMQVPLTAAALPVLANREDSALANGEDSAEAGTEQSRPEADVGLSLTDPSQVIAQLASGNLWLTLGLFFLAGLALSLTPCVFPMIPILAGVIAGQGDQVTTRKAFGLSLVYVLSMSLTYTVIGVLAGLFGENLQASFQNPWIISLFSGLFVALSLSMFGFYRLEVPTSFQNVLNRVSRSQQGGQLLGVAIMGLLSALIVGPCVAAPLAGALVYIGQTGDPVLGGLALFVLSLGMGLPLILIGGSAGKLLPRAGAWMNVVKQVFGVALLLMAVWMLDRIVAGIVTQILLASILLGCAVFMHALDRLEQGAGAVLKLGKALGVLLLIYAIMLLIGSATGQGSLLRPLQALAAGGSQATSARVTFTDVTSLAQLEPLLEQAKRRQSPVMLDFYADWCVSCKELEAYTFADPAVATKLSEFVTIRVDVTANDAASKALYQRYSIIGPPALVFYDRAGVQQIGSMLVGVPEPESFVEHLSAIR
ncbi:MAG: thiol:disulfide interchange protein DsbD [Motiliproteus sp.]|jgi:thiol:disulfide interchange protein DsbD